MSILRALVVLCGPKGQSIARPALNHIVSGSLSRPLSYSHIGNLHRGDLDQSALSINPESVDGRRQSC